MRIAVMQQLCALMRPGQDQRAHLDAVLDSKLNDSKVIEELQKEIAIATGLTLKPRQALVQVFQKGFRLHVHKTLDKALPNYDRAALHELGSLMIQVYNQDRLTAELYQLAQSTTDDETSTGDIAVVPANQCNGFFENLASLAVTLIKDDQLEDDRRQREAEAKAAEANKLAASGLAASGLAAFSTKAPLIRSSELTALKMSALMKKAVPIFQPERAGESIIELMEFLGHDTQVHITQGLDTEISSTIFKNFFSVASDTFIKACTGDTMIAKLVSGYPHANNMLDLNAAHMRACEVSADSVECPIKLHEKVDLFQTRMRGWILLREVYLQAVREGKCEDDESVDEKWISRHLLAHLVPNSFLAKALDLKKQFPDPAAFVSEWLGTVARLSKVRTADDQDGRDTKRQKTARRTQEVKEPTRRNEQQEVKALARPCHFVNSARGCLKGASCQFQHPQPAHRPVRPVPAGLCFDMQRSGTCARSFCKFSHDVGFRRDPGLTQHNPNHIPLQQYPTMTNPYITAATNNTVQPQQQAPLLQIPQQSRPVGRGAGPQQPFSGAVPGPAGRGTGSRR